LAGEKSVTLADPLQKSSMSSPATARPRALITNGEGRATVAACRCLAAAGYRVSVVAGARPAASHWSRTCDERIHLPDPVHSPAEFVDGLAELVRENAYAVFLPGSDGALVAVSLARDRFEPHVKIGLPSREAVDASLDKVRLLELGAAAGLPSPKTIICESSEEAAAAARELGFPVVLKPAKAILNHGGSWSRPNTRVVSDQAQLEDLLPAYGRPCLVQARERGVVYSCAGVMATGLLALVTSRYRRTWPPDAGEVACSETVETPPALAQGIGMILSSLGWQGLFEVELIRRVDGSFAAIDLNPRVYGSVAVAIAAGAPLPAIWCDWLLTGSAPRSQVRPGVIYRWEEGDLRHLLWQLRRGQVSSAAAVLVPHRGVVHPNFRVSDPGPLFARAVQLARRAREKHTGVDSRDRDNNPPLARSSIDR
jgi:predicted ATP-grasp superfamily ATP-dependent carboligase